MTTKATIFDLVRGYHAEPTLIETGLALINRAEKRLRELGVSKVLPPAEEIKRIATLWLEDQTDTLAGERAVACKTILSDITEDGRILRGDA